MKFENYLKEGGFNAAFFISPKGDIIYTPTKHIESVLRYPEKFGLDRDFIEYIHDFYNEKLGQEGKAREQILLSLFKKGWMRLRRYRSFWSINVKMYSNKVKDYLQKWASLLIKGKLEFREDDPYMDIKIQQDSGKVISSDLQKLAGLKESSENIARSMKIEDMEDLPLYDFVQEFYEKTKK